jgi:hypothetical protein
LKEGKKNITDLTNKWFNDIQASPMLTESDDDDDEDLQQILNPKP